MNSQYSTFTRDSMKWEAVITQGEQGRQIPKYVSLYLSLESQDGNVEIVDVGETMDTRTNTKKQKHEHGVGVIVHNFKNLRLSRPPQNDDNLLDQSALQSLCNIEDINDGENGTVLNSLFPFFNNKH